MRVLVTGATGFAGQYLAELLLSRDHALYGTYLTNKSLPVNGEMKLFRCDVRDKEGLDSVLREVRPQRIYHLAAFSSPVNSFADMKTAFDTNFWGTYNLLDAARKIIRKCRVLVVSSGQCYGDSKVAGMPLSESSPLRPQNPYALSKASADMLAGQYYSRFGLHVIRARSFNHTGPRQSSEFVCSDLARQVAEIQLRLRSAILRVGDLTIQRDFSDVRDVVRAYEMLLENGIPGETYNIASGRATSVKWIAKVLTSFCSWRIRMAKQKVRLRPGEARLLYGSSHKLSRDTGWEPQITLRTTLRDLFLYWKDALERNLADAM